MKRISLKIGDFLIFFAFLGICIFSILANTQSDTDEKYAVITAEEKEWIYSLDEEKELEFSGPIGKTKVIISNGKAWISESDCPDKLCVAMGPASRPGQWVACLPNRVFLNIAGSTNKEKEEADVYLF